MQWPSCVIIRSFGPVTREEGLWRVVQQCHFVLKWTLFGVDICQPVSQCDLSTRNQFSDYVWSWSVLICPRTRQCSRDGNIVCAKDVCVCVCVPMLIGLVINPSIHSFAHSLVRRTKAMNRPCPPGFIYISRFLRFGVCPYISRSSIHPSANWLNGARWWCFTLCRNLGSREKRVCVSARVCLFVRWTVHIIILMGFGAHHWKTSRT